MKYTVTSSQEARDQLTDLWTNSFSADRRAITQASAVIDVELKNDPDGKSTVLPEGLYYFDAPPLRAFFTLSEPDRLVLITEYVLIG
jgi:hypothetical protein